MFRVYVTVHGPGIIRRARYSSEPEGLDRVILDRDRRRFDWPDRIALYSLCDPEGLISSTGLYVIQVKGSRMQKGVPLTVISAVKE